MILHTVFCALTPDHDPAELAAVMAGLEALELDGFVGFAHGPNVDAEGKTPRYPYGFQCTFTDRAALDRYAQDAGHRALGARLVAICEGGGEGVLVSDIDTDQAVGIATGGAAQ
ncbi:Dabb family protein [Celeribacter sp.]|uniref:Dabb family protein n=1 Tax=Celeribacter sp. TaxID=1890673 RepID=UPI003A8D37F4